MLDADNVPPMNLEQARARPTAAVLAAALHGVRGNIEVARIAIAAIMDLPERQRDRYAQTILAALPVRQRDIVRKELPVKQRDELWEIEKRSGTYHEGRKEGRKEEAQRRLIQLILTVLEVRGIFVDAASEFRIKAETHQPTLERWAIAARAAQRVTELFDLQ